MAENEAHNKQLPLLYYNDFFHPNLCHVCKSAGQSKLSRCMKCKMVFYCSENHRLLDEMEHKEICQAIENVIEQKNIWDSRNMNPEEWAIFRWSNVNALKSTLQRRLRRNETEIFLNAKSCFICREQHNIDICHVCKSINMCSDHKSLSKSHKCAMRELFLEINIFTANMNKDLPIPERLLHLKPTTNNMKSFIEESLDYSESTNRWPLKFYIYSENLSKPLTLLYGMNVANLLPHLSMHDTFVIHIIGENFEFWKSLSAWEIMLHELSHITNLIIIMKDPRLWDNTINIQLCDICTRNQKTLLYESIAKEYHEYTERSIYGTADVIIGYDVELQNNQITMLNLQAMQREHCPVLLTSSSTIMTQYNIINIRNMLKFHLEPIFNNINKFPSYRPVMDYKRDTVVFPHQYLIVYQDL
ncbi:uncharacterized protein LOC116846896 [Odontomachus brunneus]|uniref:uncharacterized protein LOC116846896 n=1 Tax=Odontomachus brunneus TaxID=486640 RepID=UPI0013F1847B|nr:uncharacterized protein LOC116846896 [Odontomachus brunneus]